VATETHVAPIDAARWQEAQAGELEFWNGADRTELARYLDRIYMAELGITMDAVRGLSVLDLGGGPMPMAQLFDLPLAALTVVDPLPVATAGAAPPFSLVRFIKPAEDYEGMACDEVWGYNVLQHVRDPAAVLETAKAHAVHRIRWFDWVDSKIEFHHPHSISADWLVSQFDGWRLSTLKRGSVRVPKVQHFVALVAERT
jgi:hypothetical protein